MPQMFHGFRWVIAIDCLALGGPRRDPKLGTGSDMFDLDGSVISQIYPYRYVKWLLIRCVIYIYIMYIYIAYIAYGKSL